jgi:hypothetical protein
MPATAHANPTIGISQLLLALDPQFTGVTSSNGDGFAWYHALSIHREKRFSHWLHARKAITPGPSSWKRHPG